MGVDFHHVRFNAVAMECDEFDLVKNARKTSILESNGFQCVLVHRNCMCKHRDYVPSTATEFSMIKKEKAGMYSAKAPPFTTSGANVTTAAGTTTAIV